MRIGFIGLGRMGSAIAANLVKAEHEVTAHNRTRAKVDAFLADAGEARAGESVADASGGDVVATMLGDDTAVESVVFGSGGIIETLPPGAIHVSLSTISIALAERLAAAHAEAGQRYVSAPVFGRPEAAAAAKLFVVAAGASEAVESLREVFDAIGQRTFVVGESPEIANLIKLSGNFLIASVIESLGEAMALVTKAGVDKEQYLELLTSTLFDAPAYRTYGGLVAREQFDQVGFAATGGLKDVRLVLEAGEQLQVPLPIGSLLRDRFLTLLASGGGDLDWSAIGALSAVDSGSTAPWAVSDDSA